MASRRTAAISSGCSITMGSIGAIVMGHSLGAMIALALRGRRPERVSRLVLVDGGIDVRPEVWDSIAPA